MRATAQAARATRGVVAAALTVLAVGCAGHHVDLTVQAPATWADEPGGYETAVVTRVVDGDTIEVAVTRSVPGPGTGVAPVDDDQHVRLIGIDTPESVHPRQPVECFGKEASAAADALLAGQTVRMVKDIEDRDRFGRLLRYVYIGDEMANARLVANGYAAAYTYPPNVRHAELFVQLQREARENDRGLWAPGTCNGES